ncbi:hypothetical protein [Novilysobacter erysipheiresistens]|uniref:Uncharacterized protein n=1 Tax=Novilysobacter erysipheiresistens TaxID=1749332 RepID=A0ABU7YUH9_9GAMM
MADPFELGAQIGNALAGGLQSDGSAYVDQLGDNYDAQRKGYSRDKAMQDARRARSLAMIDAVRAEKRQTGYRQALIDVGMSPEQAALGDIILGSNTTANMSQLGEGQRPGYYDLTNLANEALVLGDIPAANRFNAGAVGDEFQPTIELGGAYINSGADVVAGDPYVPTAGTLGDLQRDEAAAQASLIRANRPPAPRRETTASSEAEVLAQARDRIAGGADPAAVAEYLVRKGYPGVAKKIATPIK